MAEMVMHLRMDDVLKYALNLVETNSKLKSFVEKEIEAMIAGNTGELFAIFYGSSMTANCGIERPDEKEILYLLLNYLLLKIENKETDNIRKIFSITNEQRSKIKAIFKILKQWLVDLIVVSAMKKSPEKNQDVKNYANLLKYRLRNLQSICILPSGFAKTNWADDSFTKLLMLESKYTGPHSNACVIEFESEETKILTQIDPISSYHRSFRELTKDQISLGLEIAKIPSENFDLNFLLPLITLKTIAGTGNYEPAHLYEVVLSKLGGEGNLRKEKEFFVNIEEKGFFSLPWTLVKMVLCYLLKKCFDDQEARSLYTNIICEFELKLLQNSFEKYTELTTSDSDTSKHQQYQFLVHEMCNKVAYDAANCMLNKNKLIVDYIMMVQESILRYNLRLNKEKRNKKSVRNLNFEKKNFESILSEILKKIKLITENITSNMNSLPSNILRKQFVCDTLNTEIGSNQVHLVKFDKILDEITQHYGFNRIIQISYLIENFIFSIVQHNGFAISFNDEKSHVELVRILIRMANLYYNCTATVVAKLYPDENCSYEPGHYTKLVLILFSLFAMIDNLVRKDKIMGSSLKNYMLSTDLENISLKSIIPQLALPERKWLDLLKEIEKYFKIFSTDVSESLAKKRCLFHYTSLSVGNDSDENNIDVKYMLSLLKNNFPSNYTRFQETLNGVQSDQLETRWKELLFTDKYLPELVRHLRDISYLSQLSLCGFPVQAIQKIKSAPSNGTQIYSRFKCNLDKYLAISGLGIQMNSSSDKKRFTDFTLPIDQSQYQKLITINRDRKNESNMIENEIIGSQHKKPENLTKPQYYRLCSIQLYDDLKFTLLYVALKNDEINFEFEEHCYLVKQALYKLGTYEETCLIEKHFQNEKFAVLLVNKFVEIVLDFKERITQYKSMNHGLDILLYLYEFCSGKTKKLIDDCLDEVRAALWTYIDENNNTSSVNNNQTLVSILSCYFILTYKNMEKIDEKAVLRILKLRVLIENNTKLYSFVLPIYYVKTMETLFKLSSIIESNINKNFSMLDTFVENSNGSWKKDTNMNLYVKDCYSFAPLKGRLFKNGHPLAYLPSQIVNNPHYKECFGMKNFPVHVADQNAFEKTLLCYEIEGKEMGKIRITSLGNDMIWIENENQTFVSKNYLGELPKFLLENCTHIEKEQKQFYTHWYENDKIYIKDGDKKVKFIIDLNSNEIFFDEFKKFIIPFVKDGFDQSNALYRIFSQFEDENYIIALKDFEQDSTPTIIYLPRLDLKFKFEDEKIMSENFKGYRLRLNQHINTLCGLTQYLLIEPDIVNEDLIKFNRKIIIPYRPIKPEKAFFSNAIEFNSNQVGKPAYFSYEIDQTLKCLNSETTAGSLYLALLYLKTATLDKDLFFEMNGYEICSEILKTCWQNCQYSDTEFNIILKFFENTCPDSEKPLSSYADQAEEMFKNATHGSNPHHRNTHAIFLRLIYLLLSSYQTDFLISPDASKKTLCYYFLQKNFVKYHFNFYLIFKDRIDKRCRLTLEEERKLLSSCVGNYSNSRISDYYKAISDKKELELVMSVSNDYKRLENSFFSKTSFIECPFEEKVKDALKRNFINDYRVHNNKICVVQNLFSDWINVQFELSYIVSLYRIALDVQSTSDFNTESFSQFLAYLFLKASDDVRVFIRMLYIVSLFPKSFKPIPIFLLLETGEIDCNQKYYLNSYSMKFSENDISDLDNDANKKIKSSIWSILKNDYLNEEQQSKFSVRKLTDTDFKLKFQNNLETILKQKNVSDIPKGFLDTLHGKLIAKTRNKELYEFFIDISSQCQTIVNSHSIGYFVLNTKDLSEVKMALSVADIENQINKNYSYFETNEEYLTYSKWSTKSIDMKKHYENLRKFFDFKSHYPDKIKFPLDPEELPEGSLAKIAFSKGYGETFVSDLKDSFEQQNRIVKINEQFFSYLIEEPVKGIDILEQLKFNYENEFNHLETTINEIRNDLFLDVEKWANNEDSKKYISRNERDKIIYMKTELEAKCQKINNELINRNILTKSIALEPLKQQLEKLKKDVNFKREARKWLMTLNEAETDIEDLVIENENLFKGYIIYHREKRILSPSVLKLICKRRKISILIYEKLDTSSFELRIVENYSYSNSECKKHFQYWLNGGKFYKIDTTEIKDTKILKKLGSEATIVGYMQTPKTKIQLKSTNIAKFTEILVDYYSEYEKMNENLFNEIYQNIMSIENQSDGTNMLILHRIMGEKIVPTKKEILSLLKDIDKLKEFNPFIIHEKDEFYKKIECFLIQETLIQQIKRAIVLISKYYPLHPGKDERERNRILQSMFINILMERSYDEKLYPTWLLFEIENNLLIRQDQYTLAETMINEKKNSIYQLNMGEGKTSVILIILSEILADGKQTVRINCLESLAGIMQELLRNKFSGLLQKKIYVMPFSRGIAYSKENLARIKEMLTDCQDGKHILLVTPEQRLCFQLKKQEMFLDYLESKDADDYFDWEEHHHRSYTSTIKPRTFFSLTDSQRTLKQALQSLGYIDSENKIIKYPSERQEEIRKFYQEMHDIIKENGHFDVKSAYEILRAQSKQLQNQRKQKLDLLHVIDDFKFFDILDESDEILCHGKEFNYTLESAESLDGGSIRWEIPFLLFKMIFAENKFGESLKPASESDECPVIFQENFRPISGIGGGCSLIRFVKKEYFLQNIVPNLCRQLCKLILSKFDQKITDIIHDDGENCGSYENFIQGKCTLKEDKIIPSLKGKSQDMLNSLLLAKAWLHHDILYHVMSYRYRVEYGLSENREIEIAIPFRGKDLPSEKSEFSHPDIMIGFTILTYLYRGLNFEQVKRGLLNLKNDPKQNRDSVLQKWVQENKKWIDEIIEETKEEFPKWLKSFKTLDLEDDTKIKKVHLYLSRNFSFIEYYLTNFTFPNDIKHYKKKLTGNAHTLAGEGKTKGFSGTDDRNDTMPESVVPKRLPSQMGTNGKMLYILSRDKNRKYISNMRISSTKEVLDEFCHYAKNNENCYVLIDAGAIITEMNNLQVSEYLIRKIDQKFDGIVYFSDENNKMMVILRNCMSFPLSTCHIDNKKLFVYLDEIHTRGTDLKLPLTACGIVTVGKNMSKDKLMQAVMRLRDLDFEQSIVLWGSKEISAAIAMVNDVHIDDITSKHVLIWVTYNTIRKNEHDLYPVTKEKLKYVIKGRALKYQKQIKTPMHSLTIVYKTESLNNIEKLYGISPRRRSPRDLLTSNSSAYLNKFYSDLEQELEANGYPNEWIQKIDEHWTNEDRPKMEKIIQRINHKLPTRILTIDSEFDGNQENEKEVEEMQQEEAIRPRDKKPEPETVWDFNKVFEKSFKEKGLHGEKDYPKLEELRKCFQYTEIDGLKKLKWCSKVFATENFTKTILDEDNKNQAYQTDYLKPVNMLLIHRIETEVSFIIVSTFEAKSLITLFHERNDPKVSLMHIDDVNGPTMVPKNAIELRKDEINNVITIIRLFNGDCRYNKDEVNVIKKRVAFLDRYCFHETKAISEKIYRELESRHYIVKGFMTRKLASKLSDQNETMLLEIEINHRIDLQSRFHSIIRDSIIDDAESIWTLPKLITQLIQIRGKSEQYHSSELKDILDMNLEKI
ncbi:unnamed protein product [Rotaria socialis]